MQDQEYCRSKVYAQLATLCNGAHPDGHASLLKRAGDQIVEDKGRFVKSPILRYNIHAFFTARMQMAYCVSVFVLYSMWASGRRAATWKQSLPCSQEICGQCTWLYQATTSRRRCKLSSPSTSGRKGKVSQPPFPFDEVSWLSTLCAS